VIAPDENIREEHNFGHRARKHGFQGKEREPYHPYDRHDGTGRGRGMKKQGAGKGNWGNEQLIYKKKGDPDPEYTPKEEPEAAEEEKVEVEENVEQERRGDRFEGRDRRKPRREADEADEVEEEEEPKGLTLEEFKAQ